MRSTDEARLKKRLDKAATRLTGAGYHVVRIGTDNDRVARPLQQAQAGTPTAFVSNGGRPLRRDQMVSLDMAARRNDTVFVLADPGNLKRRLQANGFDALSARFPTKDQTMLAPVGAGLVMTVLAAGISLSTRGYEVPLQPAANAPEQRSADADAGAAQNVPSTTTATIAASALPPLVMATVPKPHATPQPTAAAATVPVPPAPDVPVVAMGTAAPPPLATALPEREERPAVTASVSSPVRQTPTSQETAAGDMPGLVIRARKGDTLPLLYERLYGKGARLTFDEVSRLNPAPVEAGRLLFFPETPR